MVTPPFLLLSSIAAVVIALVWVATRPDVRAVRLLNRANRAMSSRHYDEALGYYECADTFRSRIRNVKVRNSVGFAIERGRAKCWLSKDRFAEAERHILGAVELLDEGVEEERRVIVFLFSDLAIAQCAQGKGSACEESLAKVESLCAETGADELQGVTDLLAAAAGAAAARNQYDAAFRLARKAVAMLSSTELWHRGQLAEVQIRLAAIHALVGEYRRAREIVEQAITSAGDDELDEDARDDALFYLGQLQLIASDFPQAIDCLQRCVELRTDTHGPEHWYTGIAATAVAEAYCGYGNYQRAEEQFRRTYESLAGQLNEDDVLLAQTAAAFALLLCHLGKYREADQLLATAEAVPAEVAKSRTSTLPAVRLVRGTWNLDQFQFDRAIACLGEGLRLAQEIYGESHIMTADARGVLGAALVRMERFEEAERLLMETLTIREAVPDASKLDLAYLLLTIAELYLATDRPGEAEAAARRAYELIAGKLLPTHLCLALVDTVLAEAVARRGAHSEALNHLRQAEDIHRVVQPPDHPRLARLCAAAVNVYSAAGDVAGADRYRRQGARIRSQFMGIAAEH